MEVWKDIIGFEGQYMVSDSGLIKSLARIIAKGKRGQRFKGEMLLRPSISKVGYERVRIGPQLISIHRIVANHFIENIENKLEVNHIDGNRANNHVKNLEWCTRSENERHARIKLGKKNVKGEKHPSSKVLDIVRNGMINMYRNGSRMCEIARQFGLNDDYVIKIIKKSGYYEKRPRYKTTIEEKRAYQRTYQRMWQRRQKNIETHL